MNLHTNTLKRIKEIDALRGTAVLLMVFSHALRWSYAGDPLELFSLCGVLTPGDLATPMFYLAAGLSLRLSLQAKLQKTPETTALRRRYTIRLGKLFLIGVFMSLTWGVLQAQALTLLALVWLSLSVFETGDNRDNRLPRFYLPAAVAFFLALHLLVSSRPLPLFRLEIFTGQFPVFAILTINACGFYLAPFLQRLPFLSGKFLPGAGLMAAALLLAQQGLPLERHGAPLPFILLGIGLGILLLGIFQGRFLQKTVFFRYLQQIGRDALFQFVFHYVAFFLPLYLLNMTGQIPATSALLLSCGVVATVTVAAQMRRKSTFTIFGLLDRIILAICSVILVLWGKPAIFPRRGPAYPREAGVRLYQ